MQKILKNERGSVALFVLLSALFFLVVVTGVAVSFKNKEAQIDSQFEKIKLSYEKDANQVYNEAVKDNSELEEQPDGTFKDSKGNEWVWIEVPNDGSGPIYPANATDKQIETALRTYCSDVVRTGTSSNSDTETTKGYTDTWYDGCGLTENEYNTNKRAMLNSIKDNGGFYIGKYETGIDDSSIAVNATTTTGLRTSSGDTTQIAVIKQNKQPYTYVTCSQAENLAEGFAIDGKTASLLFGIQWDLVLKYLNVKGVATNLLIANSTTWGNYYNNSYNITNIDAWNSTDYGANWTKGAFNKISNEYTFLTTGAHIDFSKQHIFDLAGNVWEWTLEQSFDSNEPCAYRGGNCGGKGDVGPASCRNDTGTSNLYNNLGFRVALY